MFEERVTDDLVERMHACLTGALERTRTEPFASPVTVAEIYQDLVPYRNVRTELGFDMNADYEHTLLRLLAGEGDLARLDPFEAREELRLELDSPNPNVGLFRKFAGCDVWVVARARATSAAPPPPQAVVQEKADDTWDPRSVQWLEDEAPPTAAGTGFGAPATEPEVDEGPPPEAGWTDDGAESELLLEDALEVLDELSADAATPADAAGSTVADGGHGMAAPMSEGESQKRDTPERGAAACAFCSSGLPTGKAVRFCPFCGADQSTQPCVACGEAIESGWKFCIACGSAAPDMARG